MTLIQLGLTIIFYIWLFLVAILLWIHALRSSKRSLLLQTALAESATRSAQSAHEVAEVAKLLAESIKTLAEKR